MPDAANTSAKSLYRFIWARLRSGFTANRGCNPRAHTFSPDLQSFSNLRAYMYQSDESIMIECRAEHYLEPISHYLFLVENTEEEVTFIYKSGGMCERSFNKGIALTNGKTVNAQFISIEQGTVPGFPFIVKVTPRNGAILKIAGVMHEKSRGKWQPIPLVQGQPRTEHKLL